MKTEITNILEKYMNPKGFELDMCAAEILALFGVSNTLAVGTRILNEGEEYTITDNTETFDNQAAYRLNGDMNSLWLRADFDYVIANDC